MSETIELPEVEQSEASEQELIEEIIEMQRNCSEYVTEQTPDFLLDLYRRGLLKVGRNEKGEIAATYYILPLDMSKSDDDSQQVFRLGGLSTRKTLESRKILMRMMKEEVERIEREKMKIVMKTDNEILGRFFAQIGVEELAFEDAVKKYSKAIELYVDNSKKTAAEYAGKMFYVANLEDLN